MTEIVIRKLTSDDAEDFRKIRLAALKKSPEMFGSTYMVESKRPIEMFIERLTNNVIFAAYQNKQILGVIIFHQESGLKASHKANLFGFFIEPKYRNQGIASKLLQTAIQYGQQCVEQITLSVVSNNTSALHLYQKHGFKVYGIEPNAMKSELGYQDETFMILLLA